MLSIYAAFLLDYILGDPQSMLHPVRLIGAYISSFERYTRRLVKTDTSMKAAGAILLATTVGLSYGMVFLILQLAGGISPLLYNIVNILMMYTCIAARCLSDEGNRIYRALMEGNLEKSRGMLSMIVGRDTDELDESGITRGAVETVAENTSDGVIAPLFYMFIGGAPLAMAYKAINTLDSMVGYKNEKYLHFGWASARFDDIVNYVPARLTGMLIAVSAIILRLNFRESFSILRRDSRNHSSPNSGFPEAAAAGALGVQLGGTNYYFGKPVVKPTIGEASRPLGRDDIKAMIRLMYAASILALILFSILTLIVS